MMFKKIRPDATHTHSVQFPHCDSRVLHAPGECEFCDKHSDWQQLRLAWGICFTGYEPDAKELPCPADHARGSNHEKWPGNVAQPLSKELSGPAGIGLGSALSSGPGSGLVSGLVNALPSAIFPDGFLRYTGNMTRSDGGGE